MKKNWQIQIISFFHDHLTKILFANIKKIQDSGGSREISREHFSTGSKQKILNFEYFRKYLNTFSAWEPTRPSITDCRRENLVILPFLKCVK